MRISIHHSDCSQIMGFVSWALSWFEWFGFFARRGTVVILGYDNAGKTTLLSLLKTGNLTVNAPTRSVTTEEVKIGGITLSIFDMGGHKEARRLWKDYYPTVDSIIYIIDSVDYDRLSDSCAALNSIIDHDGIKTQKVVILLNKQDLIPHIEVSDVKNLIDEDIPIFPCSLWNRTGYETAIRHLADSI